MNMLYAFQKDIVSQDSTQILPQTHCNALTALLIVPTVQVLWVVINVLRAFISIRQIKVVWLHVQQVGTLMSSEFVSSAFQIVMSVLILLTA